jgi:hypothetical protein
LERSGSLFEALEEVMRMTPGEVHACGIALRETYASQKVADRMMAVFRAMSARTKAAAAAADGKI